MSKPHSSYLTKSSSLKSSSKPFYSAVAASIMSLLVLVLGITTVAPALVNNTPQTANAATVMEILCAGPTELGGGMSQSSWRGMFSVPNSDAPGRSWTLQEAFGKNAHFVWYNGEGGGPEGNWFIVDVGTERGADFSGWSDQISRLESVRDTSTCTVGTTLNMVANTGFMVSSTISRVTQLFAVYAFDTGIVCSSATSTETGCINLLRVIGGENMGTVEPGSGDGGLIGTLTAGIYMPLIIIAVAISGLWILWIGLAKRRYREALFGSLWVFAAFIIGLTFLMKPAMLARAPMVVSNSIGACVIGAVSGNNCMDGGSSGGGGSGSSGMCYSNANGLSTDEQMSMVVNSLSCTIWAAFVLEPYAQGNFGRSLSELNIANADMSAALSAAGVSNWDICVSLRSSGSADSMGSTLELNASAPDICNLAVYQLYLSTNAVTDASDPRPAGLDTRWYNIVLTTANDDGMWEAWAPSGSASANRLSIMMVSFVSTVLGSVVIIAISFFAMMYYLTSVMLLAFAPLFFLFGIHPGRGRRILIGWGEIVLSNVFKYLASALFLVVTIQFYAAVLGAAENIGLTLLFVVILSGALLLYRNEIVNLIGQVNAGGERLSNSFSQRVSKYASKGSKIGTTAAGSAVGAAIASGGPSMRDVVKGDFKQVGKDLKRTASNVKHGAADGARREMKSGMGVISDATRQYDRMSQDNKRDLNKKANAAAAAANSQRSELAGYDDRLVNRRQSLETAEAQANNTRVEYAKHEQDEEVFRTLQSDLLREVGENNPAFAEMHAILDQLKQLKFDRDVAQHVGSGEEVSRLERQIESLESRKEQFSKQVDPAKFKEFNKDYSKELMARARAAQVDQHVRLNRVGADGVNPFLEMSKANAAAQKQYLDTLQDYNKIVADRNRIAEAYYRNEARAQVLAKEHEDLVPGESLKYSDLDKIEAKALEAYNRNLENVTPVEQRAHNPNVLSNKLSTPLASTRLDNYVSAEHNYGDGDVKYSLRDDRSVDRILDIDPSDPRSPKRKDPD